MNVQTLSISSLRNWLERGLVVFLAAFLTWGIAQAASAPAQLPMLTAAKGAAPNVVLTLDNSGSMDWRVLDNYAITTNSKVSDSSSATYKEYSSWTCATGLTGPIQDRDGRYYCIKSTKTTVCPSGFSGPEGTAPDEYCEKSTPVYSCKPGWAGPSKNNITGVQECEAQICEPGATFDTSINKCVKYTCSGNSSVLDGTKCIKYTCPKYYSLQISQTPPTCTSWLGTVNATPGAPTDANKVTSDKYKSTENAIETSTTEKYFNAFDFNEDKRVYAEAPYTSGSVTATVTTKSVETTQNDGGDWYAMRSAQVNPLYYDINKTYSPRTKYDGNLGLNPSVKYMDNQGEGSVSPQGKAPKISEKAALSDGPVFTSVICKTFNSSGNLAPAEQSCTVDDKKAGNGNVFKIDKNTTTVNLPVGNRRTDCGATPATSCSATQEWQNIYNWYLYYSTRAKATASAVGAALANPSYSGKMRVGYYNISDYDKKDADNNRGVPNGGLSTTSQGKFSGAVRPFKLGDAVATKNIFDWIYSLENITANGTPLHNALKNVGDYYSSAQPWYNNTVDIDPIGDDGKRTTLSCRRSYNILFSDGGWNKWDNKYKTTPYFNQSDLKPKNYGTDNNSTTDFSYNRVGSLTNTRSYIPYSDSSSISETGSDYALSSMASKYYWAFDLQPDLTNDLATRAGEPTNWQNMKTYTVGYGLDPVNISFEDITNWQKYYARVGFNESKLPKWSIISSTDANNSSNSGSSVDKKIDDFVRAGYAGGGAGYAVFTADDIKRTFAEILSDVVSAAGNDAGVAVSGASNTVSSIAGALKYTVDYKTLGNSGDIKAYVLNDKGANAENAERWSAVDKMPNYMLRKLSTLAGDGAKVMLNHGTTLASLPDDVEGLLNTPNNLSLDAKFINYLRGDSAVSSPLGVLYRQRDSLIAADVNSPPVYIAGRLNMGYDRGLSGVDGGTAYAGYTVVKGKTPGTLYAATNDGQVHVINAADDKAVPSQVIRRGAAAIEPGTELWSYLIRGSLSKMQAFADPAYNFEYVLDGPLSEHDIYDTTTPVNAWRQMIYGTMGRAGKSVFALNAPLNKDNDGSNLNRIPDEQGYKWEVAPANMGYVTNASTAGQTKSGDWVVLVNSGHYANTNEAGLFVLNAMTGATIKFIKLPTGYAFGRGLGGVTAIRDASRRIVGAYAGDDGGNLWRFDLSGSTSGTWGVSYNKPLFTTTANQPIYVAPAWVPHPGDGKALPDGCVNKRIAKRLDDTEYAQQCGAMVIFGTGALLDADDSANTAMQTIYGIWDKTPIGLPSTVASDDAGVLKTQLLKQEIQATATAGDGTSAGKTFYKVTSNPIDWSSHRGWYLDLGKIKTNTAGDAIGDGERVIGDVFNLGSNVFVSSVVVGAGGSGAAETCTAADSPPNFLYGVDALSGGLKRAFDQNGDGKADQFSIAYIPGGGFTRGSVITQTTKDGSASTAGIGLPNEGDPDLSIKNKCTGEQGFDTGISGSMQVFDGCPAGWNRSWRQILVPPVF